MTDETTEPAVTMQRFHQQRHRAESFGGIAEAYDQVRPTYPPGLIDDLVALAPADVLDIGAGTGRVAALLAARGLRVLGVEIDPQMAEVARGHGIEVEVASFEAWDPAGRRFDLAVSGQAWHWVDPEIGVPKLAAVLRAGGTAALFWNSATLDSGTQAVLDGVYREYAPELLNGNAGRRSEPPFADDLEASGLFARVERRSYAWEHVYTTEEWVRLIQTHSDHVTLDPARRAPLIAAVTAGLDAHGGRVVTPYSTYALFARVPS